MARTIEQHCTDQEILVQLFNDIPKLPPVEALVIILWCGLHGGKSWTFEELAKRFKVTPSRIGQIKDLGLKRLRARVQIEQERDE